MKGNGNGRLRSQRGEGKIWIVLVILIIAFGIYGFAKVFPVYTAKWDLEDNMVTNLRRMSSVGIDGVYENTSKFVQYKDYPSNFNVWEDCNVEGELGEEGYMRCEYNQKVEFPGYTYIMHVVAEAEVPEIPGESF